MNNNQPSIERQGQHDAKRSNELINLTKLKNISPEKIAKNLESDLKRSAKRVKFSTGDGSILSNNDVRNKTLTSSVS